MPALIELTDVYKIYGEGLEREVRALDGVSLSVGGGEYVAIIGPSGSGKSTLMNILGLLDIPTYGYYRLDGELVSELPDRRLARVRNRQIGFVFQGFNLLGGMTALENVELPLIYQGIRASKRVRMASAALERVGLGGRMHHKPSEMSGGQQQRVAIARAIATSPNIIMADEPTGNLDSRTGAHVIEILRGLHAEGTTILLITHDEGIARVAQRRVHINDGRITEDTGRAGAAESGVGA
ncbi:MAG: ABC transporter ATP-binding protein [Oscillospiraceae bacterium]|nr:ABC transporter ATP-binding protein [Oscillospiraceae bacterium]